MHFLSELPELVAFLGSSAVATAMLAPLIMSGTVETSSPETEAPEQQKQPKVKTVSTAAPTETIANAIDGPANEQPLQPVNEKEVVKTPKRRIRAKNVSPQLKAIEQKMVVVEKLMKQVVNLQNLQIAVEKDLANRKRDLYERTFTEYLLELKDSSDQEEMGLNKKLIQDYAAELFLKGSHQKIKFDYQRNQEKINAQVECCDENQTPPPTPQQPQQQRQTQQQTQPQSQSQSTQIQGVATPGTDVSGNLTPNPTPKSSLPGTPPVPPAIPGKANPKQTPIPAPALSSTVNPAVSAVKTTNTANQLINQIYDSKNQTINIDKLLGLNISNKEFKSVLNSVKEKTQSGIIKIQEFADLLKTGVIKAGNWTQTVLLPVLLNAAVATGTFAAGILVNLLQGLLGNQMASAKTPLTDLPVPSKNPDGSAPEPKPTSLLDKTTIASAIPETRISSASGGIIDTELHNSNSINYFKNLSKMVPYASGGAADFWSLAAVTAAEDVMNPQGRADVAQSIYNRIRSGMYDGGTSIKKNINAPGQYSVTFPNPKDWRNITDKNSANLALRRSGKPHVSAEVAAKNITNPVLMKNARKFVGGRPDFLGEQFKPNMNPKLGDITRGKTHNFFGWMNNYKGKVPGDPPSFKNIKYASGGIVNSNRSSKLEMAQDSFIKTSTTSNVPPSIIPLDPKYIQLPNKQRPKEISPLALSPPGVNIPNADVPLINRRTTGARFHVR